MGGDIQQHDIRRLVHSITARQEVFVVLCGLLPVKCCEQSLDAAGLVPPQAENFGCDTHDHLCRSRQTFCSLEEKRPMGLSYRPGGTMLWKRELALWGTTRFVWKEF